MNKTSKNIIDFWFSGRVKGQWFSSTPELDKEIAEKYEELWNKATLHELEEWSTTPAGSLALVIILDQFPLNMFRDQAKSFSSEKIALAISRKAIKNKQDKEITKEKLPFLYMPFMHSENIDDQNMSVKLYSEKNLGENITFAKHHRDIVKKYGRFPHRNTILSRESSEAELIYLASDHAYMG